MCRKKHLKKIQHPFTIQTLSKLETEGSFLNLINTTYKVLTASMVRNLKVSQCDIGKRLNKLVSGK